MKRSICLFFLILSLLLPAAAFFAGAAETQGAEGISSLADLEGKSVGVLSGSLADVLAEENIRNPRLSYFQAGTDLAVALETGKIDAYILDEPLYQSMAPYYPNHGILQMLTEDRYGFIAPKNNARAAAIMEQFNAFLGQCRADGTLDELENIWFGIDESRKVIDPAPYSGENGVLHYGISTGIGVPVSYVKDGKFVGFDVDLLCRFCRAYGYRPEITDSDVGGLLSGVSSGKNDLGSGFITITEERKESMLFSDSYHEGGFALVVRTAGKAGNGIAADDPSFFASLRESFEKTFVRENRWKLFLSGIFTTLCITLLSALCGTLLGFAVFFFYRHNHPVPNAIVNVLMTVFRNTPVVVILMVVYYVIFGKSTIGAVWVSVICFTLLFSASVIGLLKVGVGAVDRGQTEAALALGYTEPQAFLHMVLPQAAKHFLPGFCGELVSLIKGTAIVGYITVQDLTKVSDIVRSRSYEAFFPLIVTAGLYFLMAEGMTAAVRLAEKRMDPERKNHAKFLKGVKTK